MLLQKNLCNNELKDRKPIILNIKFLQITLYVYYNNNS